MHLVAPGRFQACVLLVLIPLVMNLACAPPKKPEAKPASSSLGQMTTKDDQKRLSGFSEQMSKLEEDAGTTSSFRYYMKISLRKQNDINRLSNCLKWLQKHDWADASTTSSLARQALQDNSESIALLEQAVRLDAPLWPKPADVSAPTIDYLSIQCLCRLLLFQASLTARQDPQAATECALKILTVGRHLRAENNSLICALLGTAARLDATWFLIWSISCNEKPLRDPGAAARALADDRAKCNTVFNAWQSEIKLLHKTVQDTLAMVKHRASENPAALEEYRLTLLSRHLIDDQNWSRERLYDTLSTETLDRCMNDYLAAAARYAAASPADRLRKKELAAGLNSRDLYRVPLFRAVKLPLLPEALNRETRLDTSMNMLITMLAIQQASANGEAISPEKALTELGLSASFCIDPLTGQPFQCEKVSDKRATIRAVVPEYFAELGIQKAAIDEDYPERDRILEFPITARSTH